MNYEDDPLRWLDFRRNARYLHETSPETAYEAFRPARWIQDNVVYNDGVVDKEATALKIGFELHYNEEYTRHYGATHGIAGDTSPYKVELSVATSARMRDINTTFGHELGHIFLDKVLGIHSQVPRNSSNMAEEHFCDYFGLRLAIPDEEVELLDEIDASTIVMLSERLQVSHGAILERLMRIDKLPPRLAYDVTIPYGENPIYKNKIARHVICVDCLDGTEHEQQEDVMLLPAFNFINTQFFDSQQDTHSHGYTLLHEMYHEQLNRRYGR